MSGRRVAISARCIRWLMFSEEARKRDIRIRRRVDALSLATLFTFLSAVCDQSPFDADPQHTFDPLSPVFITGAPFTQPGHQCRARHLRSTATAEQLIKRTKTK